MEDDPKDEDVVETDNVALEEEAATTEPSTEKLTENSKVWQIVAVIGLLMITGLLGYLLFGGQDSDQSGSTTQQETQGTESELPETITDTAPKLDTVVYAFADDASSDKQLYSRPASGGERTEINAQISAAVYRSAEDDGVYAFYDETARSVYYAEGTAFPSKAIDISLNDQLTGIQIDADAQKIAISTTSSLTETDPVTKITQYDFDGTNEVELISTPTEALGAYFIVDWDPATAQVLYRNSCFNCDGYNADLYWTDGSETTKIVDAGGYEGLAGNYSVTDDFAKLLYTLASTISDEDRSTYEIPSTLGNTTGAPYTLNEMDLSSQESTKLASYGKIDDLNSRNYPEGTRSGWTADERPYYTFLNKLYVENNAGNFDVLFETGLGSIISVLGIAGDEILVGTEADEGQIISYFNVDKQESEIVMETTFNTRILTVTN